MKIEMTLDTKSIQKAIRQIEQYKQDLDRKTQILIDKLSKIGIDVIQQIMMSVPSEDKGSYYTEVVADNSNNMIGCILRLSGDQVMFIEFSSGITFGTPQGSYPLPSGKPYGMGTYPDGKGHWNDPKGWWYKDESGTLHHSFGTRAYMPMYNSEIAIIMQVSHLAKEIFDNG